MSGAARGPTITLRRREVLDYLAAVAAFSNEKAHAVHDSDVDVADKLAALGLVNKRYVAEPLYWIRGEGELETGPCVLAGFVVVLQTDVPTPSGRTENFFLARAPYDGKGATFRRLLRDWMSTLDLKSRDFLGGTSGFELIAPDASVFNGDHVILDARGWDSLTKRTR